MCMNMSYETFAKVQQFLSRVFLYVLYIYNNMTLSKREKLGMFALALVVIGLVLFFTVGRSKENYSSSNKRTFGTTYWADQAYQLDLKKLSSQEAYDKVMKLPERRRKLKYLKLKANSLIFKIKNTRNIITLKMLIKELEKAKGAIKEEKRKLKGPFMPKIPIIGGPGIYKR